MTDGDLTVAELDALPAREAEGLLASCCGVAAWVEGMIARRPFGDVAALLQAADETWWSLGPDAWREMFAHHPRIGERDAVARQDSRGQTWSAGEQRGVSGATGEVRRAIAEGNTEYERRFGHIYLVAAAGKSAEELLALLRSRLSNDSATEFRVAAGEQAKITRHRLLKLIGREGAVPDAPSPTRDPRPAPR